MLNLIMQVMDRTLSPSLMLQELCFGVLLAHSLACFGQMEVPTSEDVSAILCQNQSFIDY